MMTAESRASASAAPLTKPNRPTLCPAGPVVRAIDAELWADAAQACAGAEHYAERTRRWARAAYFRARERGLNEGREEGAAEAARLVSAAQAEIGRLLAEMERQLPRLVVDIVESLLGSFDPGDLLPLAVKKAMVRLDEAADIRIKVAPAMYEVMKAAMGGSLEGDGRQRLRVEADPALDNTACSIWSEFGNVDLSIDGQLRVLREELTAAARRP